MTVMYVGPCTTNMGSGVSASGCGSVRGGQRGSGEGVSHARKHQFNQTPLPSRTMDACTNVLWMGTQTNGLRCGSAVWLVRPDLGEQNGHSPRPRTHARRHAPQLAGLLHHCGDGPRRGVVPAVRHDHCDVPLRRYGAGDVAAAEGAVNFGCACGWMRGWLSADSLAFRLTCPTLHPIPSLSGRTYAQGLAGRAPLVDEPPKEHTALDAL